MNWKLLYIIVIILIVYLLCRKKKIYKIENYDINSNKKYQIITTDAYLPKNAQQVFIDNVFRQNSFDIPIMIISHGITNKDIKNFKGVIIFIDGERSTPSQIFEEFRDFNILYLGNKELTTITYPSTKANLNIPFASINFSERNIQTPNDLLERSKYNKNKFCAYLASNCSIFRENFFNKLLKLSSDNNLGNCDALGNCYGNDKNSQILKKTNILNKYDESVELYKDYKFVMAFENDKPNIGYVTEKIVSAFLAGAIPIYWGDIEVKEIFNPNSFVYVENEEQALNEILNISKNPILYEKMINEPILNKDSLDKFFSWHESVKSDKLKNEIHSKIRRIYNLKNNLEWFNETFPHKFVINLDRSQDRMKVFTKNMDKIGIKDIKRIRGYDGEIDLERMKKDLPEIVFKQYDYKLTRGQQGCAASHMYIWKYMIENNIPYAIIFEDDSQFHPDGLKVLNEAWNKRHKNGDFFNLSAVEQYVDCFKVVYYKWEKGSKQGTSCYVITNKGAHKIFKDRSRKIALMV